MAQFWETACLPASLMDIPIAGLTGLPIASIADSPSQYRDSDRLADAASWSSNSLLLSLAMMRWLLLRYCDDEPANDATGMRGSANLGLRHVEHAGAAMQRTEQS